VAVFPKGPPPLPPTATFFLKLTLRLMCCAELYFNMILNSILTEYSASNPIKSSLRNKWSELYGEIDYNDFEKIKGAIVEREVDEAERRARASAAEQPDSKRPRQQGGDDDGEAAAEQGNFMAAQTGFLRPLLLPASVGDLAIIIAGENDFFVHFKNFLHDWGLPRTRERTDPPAPWNKISKNLISAIWKRFTSRRTPRRYKVRPKS